MFPSIAEIQYGIINRKFRRLTDGTLFSYDFIRADYHTHEMYIAGFLSRLTIEIFSAEKTESVFPLFKTVCSNETQPDNV